MNLFRPERVKTLLVDLDGTLLDNERWSLSVAFLRGVLARLSATGIRPPSWRKSLLSLISVKRELGAQGQRSKTNLARAVEMFSRELGVPEDLAEKLYRDLLRGVFPGLARYFSPKAGAREFIEWAQSRYRLVLATNPVWPPEIIELRLEWARLKREAFAFVSDAGQMTASKPDPEYYRELLARVSAGVDDCLLIGNDRKMDLPATDLGIPVFLVRKTERLTPVRARGAPAFRGSFEHLRRLLGGAVLGLSLAAAGEAHAQSEVVEYVIQSSHLPTETLGTSLQSPELQVTTSGAAGGEQWLSFHGLPARHSLILWEGMPLSDPFSPGDSADVSTVGRPVRSALYARPFGSLFGGRASGGVLDLHWMPEAPPAAGGVTGGVEFGSEGAVSENLQALSVQRGNIYSLGVRREDSRGISAAAGGVEPDGYSKTEALGGARVRLPRGEITALARHSQRETDFDGSDPLTFLPVDQVGNHASTSHSVLGLKARFELASDFELTFRGSSGFSRYRSVGESPYERFAAEHRLRVEGASQGLVSGVEAASVAGQLEAALFANESYELGDADFNAGLRYEYAAGVGTALFDSEVGLKLGGGVRWFSSFGTIARRPTLFERLGPFGNPALAPEVGFGARLGFERTTRIQSSRVALFASRLSETVEFVGIRYENRGALAPRGLEAQSEWFLGPVNALGTYQYLFRNSPEHRASFSIRGASGLRWVPDVTFTAVSERRDPFLGVALKPYGLIGGGVSGKLGSVAKLSLRVENLLNTEYQESYGYGTRGTTIWVGVHL